MQRGFSLVELSIVLVILGLLTGGILAGQSLIRAAELRAVSAEYNRYFTSIQSFRDKYMAIPGDMANATSFWGKDNTNCTAHTGTTATPGTCNGNGDGMIVGSAASSTAEMYQFWKQLALAGLIEGSYSGLTGPGASGMTAIIGTNCPASKLTNAGWGAQTVGTFGGNSDAFAMGYGNTIIFGSNYTNNKNIGAVVAPEEAWNIDTKLDDGKPGRGKVIVLFWGPCTDAATFSSLDAAYNLTNRSRDCSLHFREVF